MVTIKKTGYIWIPPINYPNYKIRVTRSGGTIDDVTDYIHEGTLTMGATEVIGDFMVSIDNSDQAYTNIYSGGEIVEIYLDYADATTRIFKGIIDKIGYVQDPMFKVTLKGRHYAEKLMTITVTQQYSNQETSVILKDLFNKYAPEFTYTNVNISATSITVNWYQKPFWDCVIELCYAAGFDAYIDDDLDCHYFEEKTIQNNTDAIVHDDNLVSVGEFGKDTIDVKNRVIVYGQELEGMPVIATAEDTTSQSALFIKEEIVTDKNITTTTQAQERADEILARLKDSVDRGEVEAYPGLATLKPGEMLFISDPINNLTTFYKIISFTHTFSIKGMETKVTIEREITTVAGLMKERILSEQKLSDIANPFEMRYSYNFTFDNDSQVESHTYTETSAGRLVLESGESTGTMISIAKAAISTITSVHLKVKGEGLVGTEYWVSADNGATWEEVSPDVKKDLASSGKYLKVKIRLNSSATQIDSLAILYK